MEKEEKNLIKSLVDEQKMKGINVKIVKETVSLSYCDPDLKKQKSNELKQ